MGITSGALARDLIDAIAAEGSKFAVLHRREDLKRGVVESDIDLVIAEPPTSFVKRLRPRLRQLGLRPILEWQYDAGGTATVFLASDAAEEGIQLDLLYDPLGLGKYRVRTDLLLEEVDVVDGWPSLNRRAELVYLLRKRLVKRDAQQVGELRESVSLEDPSKVEALVRRLMTPSAARSVLASIRPGPVRRSRIEIPSGAELARVRSRLTRPIGAWIHVEGPFEVEVAEVVNRLRRFLPRTGKGAARGSLWFWREVAEVRWRAGVFVSWGRVRTPNEPDIALGPPQDPDDLARLVITSLAHRIEDNWG